LGRCLVHLAAAVEAGRVRESDLDRAVAKVLRVKFMLGLFEDPYVDEDTAVTVTNCAEHRALALEAARKAMVLLKNEGGLLPLDPANLGMLAVIGPNAAAVRLGGYSGDPVAPVSVLDGLRQFAGGALEIRYAEGCGLTQSPGTAADLWFANDVLPADPARDDELIAEAVEIAKCADVVLLVLGDNEQTCREGWSTDHLGDRDSLDLPGRQEDLLRAVASTGKPVILLLINGRPASINFRGRAHPGHPGGLVPGAGRRPCRG
jgi:beta-glucosidase